MRVRLCFCRASRITVRSPLGQWWRAKRTIARGYAPKGVDRDNFAVQKSKAETSSEGLSRVFPRGFPSPWDKVPRELDGASFFPSSYQSCGFRHFLTEIFTSIYSILCRNWVFPAPRYLQGRKTHTRKLENGNGSACLKLENGNPTCLEMLSAKDSAPTKSWKMGIYQAFLIITMPHSSARILRRAPSM